MSSYIITYPDGKQEYYCDDKLHRTEGPAVIGPGVNDKQYYIKGKLHRTDGPALISAHTEEYYINGKLHRINGPALVGRYNTNCVNEYNYRTEYYFKGKLHRIDGPAVSQSDKGHGISATEKYYINGKLHRIDGPAIIHNANRIVWGGNEHYYINDKEVHSGFSFIPIEKISEENTTLIKEAIVPIEDPVTNTLGSDCIHSAIELSQRYPEYHIRVVQNDKVMMRINPQSQLIIEWII